MAIILVMILKIVQITQLKGIYDGYPTFRSVFNRVFVLAGCLILLYFLLRLVYRYMRARDTFTAGDIVKTIVLQTRGIHKAAIDDPKRQGAL